MACEGMFAHGRRSAANRCTAGQRIDARAAQVTSPAWVLTLVTALLSLLLAGCKSPPPPPQPTRVIGSIDASQGLNPSQSQRPSPAVMRVYELKSATAFNQADFMALYRSDSTALGAELVGKEELVLQPGETRPLAKVLAAETRFIGVVVFYRDLEKATWRTLVPVQPAKTQTLRIRADSLMVSATVQ